MDVRLINTEGVQRRKPHELPALLGESGLVWIDVPYWDAETASFLSRLLRLHPRAVHDCTVDSAMPKVHVYADHVFVVLHGLEPGAGGHVHHIELDQFVGPNWVLTVHGRMDPEVVLEAAFVETTSVLRKLESGEFTPSHTHEHRWCRRRVRCGGRRPVCHTCKYTAVGTRFDAGLPIDKRGLS